MLNRPALSVLILMTALGATAAVAPAQIPAIRPVDSLTFAAVTHEERGDVETLISVSNVTPTQYVVNVAGSIPNAADPTHPKWFRKSRRIRTVDDSLAHRINMIYSEDDPPMFPGTASVPSRAMLADLKTKGSSQVIVGDAPPGAFASFIGMFAATRNYYRGKLVAVGRSTVNVIANDVSVALPAIEARGHLIVGGESDDIDVFIFDNPDWPLVLKWTSQGRVSQLTEISWPTKGVKNHEIVKGSIQAVMGKTCRAEVHGIYFAFASATLAPQSDLALGQVATLLADNPSLAVTIEGHTDNIGTPKANLDLSKRRAAAVRDALVTRFHVAPGRLSATGFGDTRPIESNKTVDGRARNRRVELSRKC